MKIHNVRLGFATNSSSSHSIVFLKGASDSDVPFGDGYGWENFTLASDAAKRGYLSVVLRDALRGVGADVADAVAQRWLGRVADKDGYIDHQSSVSLPRDWAGEGIDKKFWDEFSAFVLRDGAVILGGNDNGDGHPLSNESAVDVGCKFGGVARKDEANGYWTIFNRDTGTKLRMTFASNNPTKDAAPTKATYPELVDLKITNRCDAGCGFCYQSSTPDGEHAKTDDVWRIIRTLAGWRVFEIAIGGGEPTCHPKFLEILRDCRKEGIVPNFTTRARKWLRGDNRAEIVDLAGAIGFSVETGSDVDELAAALRYHGVPHGKATCQFVVGGSYSLQNVVERCVAHGMPLLLLGFKRVGRGAKFRVVEHADWIDVVRKAANGRYFTVGIDTALAVEGGKKLRDVCAGNNSNGNVFFATQEGKFSMYVDAIRGACAPSSYCEELQSVKFDMGNMVKSEKTIARAFAGW